MKMIMMILLSERINLTHQWKKTLCRKRRLLFMSRDSATVVGKNPIKSPFPRCCSIFSFYAKIKTQLILLSILLLNSQTSKEIEVEELKE